MASHYSDMGFKFKDDAEFNNFINAIYVNGKKITTNNGLYVVVIIDKNTEFWFQIKKTGFCGWKRDLVGLEFHYSSDNLIPVRFEKWIEPRMNLSGEAYVWYRSGNADFFPFIVSVPNADEYYHLLKSDKIMAIQVACFAESLELFDSSEEYDKSQKKAKVKFADEHFIPAGAFNVTDEQDKNAKAEPYAIFGGHILKYERRINSYTGNSYYYFSITCQGAVFDVLADEELLNKDPKVNGILVGTFWMSGKIVNIKN